MMTWLGFAAGVLVVIGAAHSVIGSLVVPRRVHSKLTVVVEAVLDRLFLLVLWRVRDFATRDKVLAWQAPLGLVVRLAVWMTFFVLGFGLMLLPAAHGHLGSALTDSGSSIFTLGYAVPAGSAGAVLAYFAAFTGLVVVGLQVGYLPTIYAAFNRRETEVSLLIARAGLPAWGPEILARTLWGTGQGDVRPVLDDLFVRWERWTAEVVESHTTYPTLLRLRSPQPMANWLTSLIAVMDAAAMHLALAPDSEPRLTARLALRMGFTSLRNIAQSMRLDVVAEVDPAAEISVSEEEFRAAAEMLVGIGYPVTASIEEAWPHFRGWRVNYDDTVLALARLLDAPPALWTGSRRWPSTPVAPWRPPTGLARRGTGK